jgi:predicted  nucleic acid-binding Zn-ribbon protein
MAKVRGLNEKYLELAKKNLELNDRIEKMKHNFHYTIEKSELAYAKLESKYNKLNKEFGELEEENLVLRTALKVTL